MDQSLKEHSTSSTGMQDTLTTVHWIHHALGTLVPKSIRPQQRPDSLESTGSGYQDERQDHTPNGEPSKVMAASSLATSTPAITSRSSTSVFNGRTSIAAATVLGIITFAALLFLAIWYLRHHRRRRKHKLLTQNQDFGQSEITLGEDTSKTLDDFLMKDVPLERTSFMFSRSRSPSITFVVDEAERPSLNKARNSYGASSSSQTKLESLTRISTDGTRPSLLSSELTMPTSQSAAVNSSSKPASTNSATPRASPRVSVSSSQLWTTITSSTDCPSTITQEQPSTAPPTSRSSQVWTTTTGSTENNSSMTSPDNRSRLSNGSRASSRLSAQSQLQGGVRLSNAESTGLRRYQRRSQSRSSQNTVVPVSPTAESGSSGSGQLPSIPSTPSPLFRSSES